MAEAGAAVVIADGELTPDRAAAAAVELLRDRKRLAAMAAASARLARPDAARRVAREVLAAVGS
jgi:UDP-N-acetylglucosamine--N-acetylmuramyl-(pentapeptide) pyrophosphoryl-undecaprenol N-acetylglucosamine transferase